MPSSVRVEYLCSVADRQDPLGDLAEALGALGIRQVVAADGADTAEARRFRHGSKAWYVLMGVLSPTSLPIEIEARRAEDEYLAVRFEPTIHPRTLRERQRFRRVVAAIRDELELANFVTERE